MERQNCRRAWFSVQPVGRLTNGSSKKPENHVGRRGAQRCTLQSLPNPAHDASEGVGSRTKLGSLPQLVDAELSVVLRYSTDDPPEVPDLPGWKLTCERLIRCNNLIQLESRFGRSGFCYNFNARLRIRCVALVDEISIFTSQAFATSVAVGLRREGRDTQHPSGIDWRGEKEVFHGRLRKAEVWLQCCA
ncbi:bll5008 [Bradyrhizobium diazoefficiens USDA 110]|uniref:Bll5008 protein n=1 Tax=Bradyrhizobium diazoefficiens (strain JCM 10833 / BCRC 13528 / IAM 13628 / NBRC 14792 / USDA 110) TaxID=224911 RepID=Q89KA1_BRADU|nr:hypothetical protein Bdiaspc4_26310 [Bradyrhizobium diazoefficiens]BAC50273.1 bll5008 [Bradyrhizobium diazoefficiens USDA 110]